MRSPTETDTWREKKGTFFFSFQLFCCHLSNLRTSDRSQLGSCPSLTTCLAPRNQAVNTGEVFGYLPCPLWYWLGIQCYRGERHKQAPQVNQCCQGSILLPGGFISFHLYTWSLSLSQWQGPCWALPFALGFLYCTNKCVLGTFLSSGGGQVCRGKNGRLLTLGEQSMQLE